MVSYLLLVLHLFGIDNIMKRLELKIECAESERQFGKVGRPPKNCHSRKDVDDEQREQTSADFNCSVIIACNQIFLEQARLNS